MTQQKAHQRRGLGRGLGSLIPTAPQPDTADTEGGSVPGQSTGESGQGTAGRPADWIGALGAAASADPADPGQREVDAGETTDDATNGFGPGPVAGAYFAELRVAAIAAEPSSATPDLR